MSTDSRPDCPDKFNRLINELDTSVKDLADEARYWRHIAIVSRIGMLATLVCSVIAIAWMRYDFQQQQPGKAVSTQTAIGGKSNGKTRHTR